MTYTYKCHIIHFNSQPHEEADKDVIVNDSELIISTHSLTRRLTKPETICHL